LTVAGDTFSVSAVSSTLIPPKNRYSTILRLTLVQGTQTHQRFVERQELVTAGLGHSPDVAVEMKGRLTAAALLPAPRHRIVDEDAPHRLRGNGEIVRAVLPLDAVELGQLEPRFVDEGRRAQRVTGPLVAQLPRGDPAKLVIDERKNLLHLSRALSEGGSYAS
jgi:hypothetical protein